MHHLYELFLLKNLSFGLSAYLSFYKLSIAFYLKNYCIFIIVFWKALSIPAATRGESPSFMEVNPFTN